MALRAYKVCISPYFRGSCRFLPSCADYAAEAIERHGVLQGTWLAARRLARCHPLCAAGLDPVPVPTRKRGIAPQVAELPSPASQLRARDPQAFRPARAAQEFDPALNAGPSIWARK